MTSANRPPAFQPPVGGDGVPPQGELRAALLTTFDPPDAGLLIEELLPAWLAMDRAHADSGEGRSTFLVDLQERLRRLRGKVGIFCSPRAEPSCHWLWREIRLLPVGVKRRAVQHSKVWLFHRGPAPGENFDSLEIVVSSTNLTRPAFTQQVQAGWRAVVPLGSKNARNLDSWGVMPQFLEELAASAGRLATPIVRHWLRNVLTRCAAPSGVEFLASVPGSHSSETIGRRGTCWGTRGLRNLRPSSSTRAIDIVVPTVGAFSEDALGAWAAAAGSKPSNLRVAWVAKDGPKGLPHPWASGTPKWVMPAATRKSLEGMRIDLRAIPSDLPLFHKGWDKNDDRWLHAKLYWVRDGRKTRLLVTSANWSEAAWGRRSGRKTVIENFEFGVAVEADWQPLLRLPRLNPRDAVTTLVNADRREPALAWGAASWDGRSIVVDARVAAGATRPAGTLKVLSANPRSAQRAVKWREAGVRSWSGRTPWGSRSLAPVAVEVEVGASKRAVFVLPVADLRPPAELTGKDFGDVSREDAERLELALLEERYGGAWVEAVIAEEPSGAGDDASATENSGPDADSGPESESEEEPEEESAVGPGADYRTAAVTSARDRLAIVSSWARALSAAVREHRAGAESVKEDGRRLARLWRARLEQASIGERVAFRVAIDEIQARLGEGP